MFICLFLQVGHENKGDITWKGKVSQKKRVKWNAPLRFLVADHSLEVSLTMLFTLLSKIHVLPASKSLKHPLKQKEFFCTRNKASWIIYDLAGTKDLKGVP